MESKGIDGGEFTQLVLQGQLNAVGVVSPLQVSKICKAWRNVLAEDAMADAAKSTVESQQGVAKQKAVKLIC